MSYDAVIHTSCVLWHSADCFMPCTRSVNDYGSACPQLAQPSSGDGCIEMTAGLGSLSADFYFTFPFGNESCGCLGRDLHLPNLSQLWCILTCKQTPGPSKKPSKKDVLGTIEAACCSVVSALLPLPAGNIWGSKGWCLGAASKV